jgi:hypothetical protein
MSQKVLQLVERFFSQRGQQGYTDDSSCFAEDATYELFVSSPKSVRRSWQGRRAIQDYYSVVQQNYKILYGTPRTLSIESGNAPGTFAVVVNGSELAHLELQAQHAWVEWAASLQIDGDFIKKVTMTIYRFTEISESGLERFLQCSSKNGTVPTMGQGPT